MRPASCLHDPSLSLFFVFFSLVKMEPTGLSQLAAKAPRRCQFCSNLTLERLHAGTDYYALSRDCDLCQLVFAALDSKSYSNRGRTPIIRLKATYRVHLLDNGLDLLDALHWSSRQLKQYLYNHLPVTRNLIHPNIKAYPLNLLDVRTENSRNTLQLKISAFGGKLSNDDRDRTGWMPKTSTGSRQNLAPYVSGRPIKPAVSQDNIDMIRGWISTCLCNHSKCRKTLSGRSLRDNVEEQPLPTRLIEVSPRPRLRETAGQSGQYLALSYCWGTSTSGQGNESPNAMTTRESIRSFYDHIDVDTLAPTVKDAISLTQRLGYRYLWVDALCIIQGDADDWTRESRQMAGIFENALCTIVALGADHAGEGLFLSGNDAPAPGTRKEAILPCVTRGGKMLGEASLTVWPPPEPESEGRPVKDFIGARWSRRGWVLQERMLSRRMVYFGRSQLYWMCGESMIHEDGINHDHPNVVVCTAYHLREFFSAIKYATILHHVPLLGHLFKLMWGNKNTIFHEVWETIIGNDYARCNLTVQSDKLMAVAGLAAAFGHRTGLTYFEGIWIELASFGLAWSARTLSDSPAPSWSWGRSHGALRFMTRHLFDNFTKPRANALIRVLGDGTRVLELKAPILRIASTECIPDCLHFEIKGFVRGEHLQRRRTAPNSKECSFCVRGEGTHAHALNHAGQICGLLEFDRLEYHTQAFEALVLLSQKVSFVTVRWRGRMPKMNLTFLTDQV